MNVPQRQPSPLDNPPAWSVVPSQGETMLDVRGLHVTFDTPVGPVPAVRGVDMSVRAGETLAVVGESGSGKSTSVLGLLGLLPARRSRVTTDSLRFEGAELSNAGRGLAGVLGRRIGVVFQDPQSSLNPTMRVGAQIGEALAVHHHLSRAEVRRRVLTALDEVAVPDPERCAKSYPHQLSGGMRQRVMIAIATVISPSLLIADEPTTALDVTIQSQIVDLLLERQRTQGMAIVFITHDLSLVSGFADQTMVMYAGQVVEHDATERVVASPAHPYTTALLGSVPSLRGGGVHPIAGRPPSPRDLPTGCAFAPRCTHADDRCTVAPPDLTETADAGAVRCWLADPTHTPTHTGRTEAQHA